jgi:hypothetical protein
VIVLRRGTRATVHPRLAERGAPRADEIARVRADLERTHTAALLLGMEAPALRALVDEVFGPASGGRPA